jgi:hypothetical protein
MKSIKFSSSRRRFFNAVLFLLAWAGLMFVSCVKEKLVEIPVIQTVTDTVEIPVVTTCDRPHESEDLVAWYNPLNDVFLINPQYVENVLVTLQAQPTSNGRYIMEGVNLHGELRLVHFQIVLASSPDIFIKAEATEKPLTPDLISTFEEKGTSYRVYKNAECGKAQAGFNSACENGADGTSTKRTWYDIRRCERGNGFCTEAKGLIGKSVTYHNANCQGPVKEEKSLYGYACWQ